MKVIYRKIDTSNPNEMNFVAERDSKIPLQFDSDYTWNEKSVASRLEYYQRAKPDDFFEVASQDGKIIGFHLILKFPYPPDLQAGMIATLWVDPSFRGKGIGLSLKTRGEKWAREQNLAFLQTGVHPSNATMMEMNAKSGFSIVQHTFRKKL